VGAFAPHPLDRRAGPALSSSPGWKLRAGRAATLVSERPHVAPQLGFYRDLLEVQARAATARAVARWSPVVTPQESSDPLRLRLERLPLDELSSEFHTFCRSMPMSATEPIVRVARSAAMAADTVRYALLLALLTGADFETEARELGCEPGPVAFLPRAFLQPIAEALAEQVATPSDTASGRTCPVCGWPPQVSALQDEPEAQGNRRLICAFCASAWTFPRSVCVGCAASGEKGLEFHVDEDALPYVRVETCRTCQRYLKTVDLRVSGLAVPIVEDLATPELDLWATEQGLQKIVPNLLGL